MQYNKNNLYLLYLGLGSGSILLLLFYCFISLFGLGFGFWGLVAGCLNKTGSGKSNGGCGGLCSGKVGGHVALQVEVREFLALLQFEEGLQLGIGG